jgi:hypothetical protein
MRLRRLREARSGWAQVAGLTFAGALIIGGLSPLLVVLGALSVIGGFVVWGADCGWAGGGVAGLVGACVKILILSQAG